MLLTAWLTRGSGGKSDGWENGREENRMACLNAKGPSHMAWWHVVWRRACVCRGGEGGSRQEVTAQACLGGGAV